MRVLVALNHPRTNLGTVGLALAEAGATLDIVQCHEGEALPATHDGFDALVVYGGGQNALADDEHPYLPHLAGLTRAFGEAGKAVLGICLGSQIIARGHGAKNIIGREIEFGWQEIRPTPAGRDDPMIAALGEGAALFEWHNDTFELPEGAVHLAENAHTRHQCFRIGRAVYACQFHFEAHRQAVGEWVEDYAELIAREVPGWLDRYGEEAGTRGAEADATGMAIARAWVGLIRPDAAAETADQSASMVTPWSPTPISSALSFSS
ncbi:type 1 glutamine amidotransferase [Methylobrevis pamukkalensis]|uniref:Glutamine amidotransferase n=1 Tax=Methylobrevis pamukkalensis TaxID=1439726 RepID=A0A1E3H5U4_9HYPH|nr:type 1 glutamine amidotransferase [Methylobrevis pamukkalensis]ODN71687.1 glutamine amidotransferase [Methylobrevis pamukkalensis]